MAIVFSFDSHVFEGLAHSSIISYGLHLLVRVNLINSSSSEYLWSDLLLATRIPSRASSLSFEIILQSKFYVTTGHDTIQCPKLLLNFHILKRFASHILGNYQI